MMTEAYSVSQVTSYLKGLISRDAMLRSIAVEGELSNVKYHTSGHIYFTLKDAGASLSCVMFSSDARSLNVRLKDGMKVEAAGRIDVYEKNGAYQLYARRIRAEGEGELYERFMELKQELEDMGMFSERYKQPIPAYVRRLGVVTAPTGAAVRDIIRTVRYRNPYVEIVLYPAQVQGKGAALSIAKGIEVLDGAGLDVIIVGRGGGSFEDLWEFNERVTAEAIFNADTPIISAVGHETDTTIADYVSDARAATPTAAAVLAVHEYAEFVSRLEEARSGMKSLMASRIRDARTGLMKETGLKNMIGSRIMKDKLRLKEYEAELKKKRPDAVIAQKRLRLADIDTELRESMKSRLAQSRDRLSEASGKLPDAMHGRLRDSRHAVSIYAEKLKGVSPLEKLTMGYSYVSDESGANVRDAGRLSPGDRINIYMLNGKVGADVREVKKNEH